jgi:hypothetical protein
VNTLPLRVARCKDRYLQGLSPRRVFAPSIATEAHQPVVALLLHSKNHPLRVYGLDHYRHRKCVVATIPNSTKTSIAENTQPAASTDIARSPLENRGNAGNLANLRSEFAKAFAQRKVKAARPRKVNRIKPFS